MKPVRLTNAQWPGLYNHLSYFSNRMIDINKVPCEVFFVIKLNIYWKITDPIGLLNIRNINFRL